MNSKSSSSFPSSSSKVTYSMSPKTGSRLKKKHKRLDSISETAYNKNHSSEAKVASGVGNDPDIRRSSRVRRTPVLLDTSPEPVRKRKKVKLGGIRKGKSRLESVDEGDEEEADADADTDADADADADADDDDDADTPDSWKSRLRARVSNVWAGRSGGTKKRRKLFDDSGSGSIEFRKKNVEFRGGKLESKRIFLGIQEKEDVAECDEGRSGEEAGGVGVDLNESVESEGESELGKSESGGVEAGLRVKENESAGNVGEIWVGEDEGAEDDCGKRVSGHDSGKDEMEVLAAECEEHLPVVGREGSGESDGAIVNGGGSVQIDLAKKDENEILDDLNLGKRLEENDDVVKVEKIERNMELGNMVEGENDSNAPREDGAVMNDAGNGGSGVAEDMSVLEDTNMQVEGEKNVEVDKARHNLAEAHKRPQIKQGRRCGLCGCGTDGKPPKKLVQNGGESENETYSGSSASEEPNYDILDGFGDEPDWQGRLLGPINDRYGIAGIWVHQHCAVWSPEVYFAGLGHLKNVRAALLRGRALKCSRCGRPGATIGCRVDRCPKTYHLPCARAEGCIFDHRKFLIACTDHRHLFQPHGNRYRRRMKKLKAMKIKLGMRKLSNEAWRKDLEAEEKWLENCGEDEEFLKRESKRLHRDLLRIAPVYIGGADSDGAQMFEGWESVAGLQDVIQCMKEVVILPLLYPEFFSNMGITPPRGVLLHGHPGTGKTLVVRALIGSCARGDKRIAYFARKGADCLGKYVGDAERQLRLLFQVAEKCQPSIIFFDEIDGLAPCRTRQQDQTHSSVVSTLLALMDGLKSRGSVVVIGATNRPEAVDPALRRPGRFDREIYFPLPSSEDRAAILSLHTQRWPKPVSGSLLKWIAGRTVGYAGADLQALCTQAAINALKRNCLLQEILSAAGRKTPLARRVPFPAFAVEERDWLDALACAPPPCSRREAGIAANDLISYPLPAHLIPCLLQPLITMVISLYLDEHLWLPPLLTKAGRAVENVIVSSLKEKKVPVDRWWCHVDGFLEKGNTLRELQRRLSCAGILVDENSLDTACGTNGGGIDFESSSRDKVYIQNCLIRGVSLASRKKSGFRILIAGSPRSGQKHLAACVLHCFVGNVEIQKVDLATISHEGHGDMVQGVTRILMKCSSLQSCMIYMPRIDLWAAECHHIDEDGDLPLIHEPLVHSGEVESANSRGAFQKPSQTWSSFVEQVESICVTTSLMILATSELPYLELPLTIRKFFKSDMSNSHAPNHLGHTVPQFCLPLNGNLDQDAMIRLSVAELSRDAIRQFVCLIHQRAHRHPNSFEEYKTSDSGLDSLDTEHHDKNLPSDALDKDCQNESSVKVIFPPNNFTSKGKSSLALALAGFGYQILRYPHFAELCWVTSKLKEGPCTDVSGPWKGWPFNSCIIRPANSVDKHVVACSSCNIKNKEWSCLVIGLVAVGLMAYRGVYTSLREVCFEVRKVLELLVGHVNEKVQAGKDRFQYVRILSQVAYLEDMVNGWAFSLQSLEHKVGDAKLIMDEVPDNGTYADRIQTETRNGSCSDKRSHETEGLEGSPERIPPKNVEDIELVKDGSFCDLEATGLLQPKDLECPSATDLVVGDAMKEKGENLLPSDPVDTETLDPTNGNLKSLKHSKRITSAEPMISPDNAFSVPCDSVAAVLSDPCNSFNETNGLPVVAASKMELKECDCCEPIMNANRSRSENGNLLNNRGVVCSYYCCAECVHALFIVIQDILVDEWQAKGSHSTVEDVHDVVAMLSMKLLSVVRKVTISKGMSNSSDENLQQGNLTVLAKCSEFQKCKCETSTNNLVVTKECRCHNVGGLVTEMSTSSLNSPLELDLKFMFRDGVLVPVDSTKDASSLCCTYEKVCLCYLKQSIAMMR